MVHRLIGQTERHLQTYLSSHHAPHTYTTCKTYVYSLVFLLIKNAGIYWLQLLDPFFTLAP